MDFFKISCATVILSGKNGHSGEEKEAIVRKNDSETENAVCQLITQNTINYSYTLYRTRLYRNSHIPDREFQSRKNSSQCMFWTVWYSDIPDFLYSGLKILVPTPVRYKSN